MKLHSVLPLLLLVAACEAQTLQHYEITKLVANDKREARLFDPNLDNCIGMARLPSGAFWVADHDTGVATDYPTDGSRQTIVTIPGATVGVQGTPTGLVANTTSGFAIAAGVPAQLIFATDDGTISGWNSSVNPTAAVIMVNNSPSADYTGLTMGTMNGVSVLYAANFFGSKVEAFDINYAPVVLPGGAFTDSALPAGYAPYSVQAAGSVIITAFALQDSTGHHPVKNAGLGFVDIFDGSGDLMSRLQSGQWLDVPWGAAVAGPNFGKFSNALLIGQNNIATGGAAIIAYNPQTGKALGALEDSTGQFLTPGGVFSLVYTGASQPTGSLYFTWGEPGFGVLAVITPIQ